MIKILQVKPKTFKIGSWLIMKNQKTDYSHYVIKVESSKRARYFDSTFKSGVRRYAEREFRSEYDTVHSFTLPVRPQKSYEILSWLIAQEGKKYGIFQLIGIALNISLFRNGSKQVICNELVLRLLNEIYDAKIGNVDMMDLIDTEFHVKRFI